MITTISVIYKFMIYLYNHNLKGLYWIPDITYKNTRSLVSLSYINDKVDVSQMCIRIT